MINYLWIVIQILIGYNLILPIILYLLWLFVRKEITISKDINQEKDFAIIVTAYEQITTIPAVVHSLLKLNYSNYLIYVVADKCDLSNLSFDDERVILLRPPAVLASNTKSHLYAIRNFKRKHEFLTIIDSDNLVDVDYLQQSNLYLNNNFDAVQGLRAAKNLNTTYACLDAARDMYYHFYDGRILFDIGSSATLSGSGMSFKSSIYSKFLLEHQVEGAGFDKVLQNFLVGNRIRIAFNERAIVFDEKTTKSDQLVKQRARWINSWFKYASFGFDMLIKGIMNMNWNQGLFGLILVRPPLFMFLLLSLFCLMVNLFVAPLYALIWLVALTMFVLGFMISLFYSNPDKRVYQALVGIPKFIFMQLKSLIRSKNANRDSVATQHFH